LKGIVYSPRALHKRRHQRIKDEETKVRGGKKKVEANKLQLMH